MYLSRLQTRLKNINKYKGALIIKKNIDVLRIIRNLQFLLIYFVPFVIGQRVFYML